MSSRTWRSLCSAAVLGLLLPGGRIGAAPAPEVPSIPAEALWQDVDLGAFTDGSVASGVVPGRARSLRLDLAGLRWLLSLAPPEQGAASTHRRPVLPLPLPGGGFELFRLEETAVLHPELAQKFPEIRTFRGTSTSDAAHVAHLDLTEHGFHAMVLSPKGSLFVDPARRGDLEHYVAYQKRDFAGARDMVCGVHESVRAAAAGDAPLVAGTLRTYRLAVGATGEYTAFHGGTVSAGLSGITTTMTRVNGVYERDFSVRMQLIANNNLIVYTNASTDPYTDGSAGTLINQNQSNTDSVIGSANYDIGHVFSIGGSGLAGLGVVCRAGNKARGVTGRPSPVGDPYDIDYVAHEMGHQFGGNHTFNGTTSSCSGNRSASSAYEPGSGSTIMAYAGICGAEDLQPNSDDSFHARSLDEISAYIAGSGACGSTAAVANSAPSVNAGAAFTIPSRTPFTLTASASDVNGDALTYSWEQFNLGAASPPNTDDGSRPIFRSFAITSSPARTFPRLSDILNNTATLGESLPTTTRTMTFRVTARDNHAGGGAYAIGSTTVTSRADSGPFAVTAPNTAVSWSGGSSQTVTWAVANTNLAPVSTASVRVLLSTDGGNSFPTVLLASTPNDGSEAITVPNTPTTQARVKVEAVGNVYFDISNANFTITGGTPTPDFSIACSPSSVSAAPGGSVNSTCTVTSTNGFASAVALSCAGLPAGVSCAYAPSSVTPPANGSVNSTLTISVASGTAAGTSTFQARGTSGALVKDANITLTVTGGTTPVTVTFTSQGANDGRTWESTETSNVGGGFVSSDTSTSAIRVGDLTTDRSYRSVLSFDTSSIPDTATITAATVRLVRGTISGTNPFTILGTCQVDIRNGFFGTAATLANADFEAAATATAVASLSNPTANGSASTGTLSAAGLAAISKTGTTQLKLYFTTDDNDNNAYDYIGFYGGEAATAANRPTLTITYTP
jgi:hypothetical protein